MCRGTGQEQCLLEPSHRHGVLVKEKQSFAMLKYKKVCRWCLFLPSCHALASWKLYTRQGLQRAAVSFVLQMDMVEATKNNTCKVFWMAPKDQRWRRDWVSSSQGWTYGVRSSKPWQGCMAQLSQVSLLLHTDFSWMSNFWELLQKQQEFRNCKFSLSPWA